MWELHACKSPICSVLHKGPNLAGRSWITPCVTNEDVLETKTRIATTLLGRANPDAACVSLIVGSTVAEVLNAFDADPDQPAVPRNALAHEAACVVIVEASGGIVAIEDNGYQGSMAEVMRPSSAHGRAASMFWNDNGESSMTFAEREEIRDSGEYFPDENPFDDADIAALVEEVAALPDVDPTLVGLLAIERFTGMRIDASPASPPARVYRILPRLDDHMTGAEFHGTMLRASGEAASALVDALRTATAERQRYLAAVLAQQMLARAGLDGHPDLADTVATILRPGGAIITGPAETLMRRALDPASNPPAGHIGALRVLHRAANPDPHVAALEAVKYAAYMLPKDMHEQLYTESTRVITS